MCARRLMVSVLTDAFKQSLLHCLLHHFIPNMSIYHRKPRPHPTRSKTTQNCTRFLMGFWVPSTEHISTATHRRSRGQQPGIEREVYPRTVSHAAALIYASSTCSVDGMDLQLMPHCTMMHISMTFPFPREGTISLMQDLVPVTHYLFHIEAFAIILLNGARHL